MDHVMVNLNRLFMLKGNFHSPFKHETDPLSGLFNTYCVVQDVQMPLTAQKVDEHSAPKYFR